MFSLSFSSFKSRIFISSSSFAKGLIATPTFLLKIPLCNLSNTCHIDSWISFAHQTTTPIPTSNLLPSSHLDDDGDSKGEIATNGTMLYIGPLTCHSNSSCVSWCLTTTSSTFFFPRFYTLLLYNFLCLFFPHYALQSFKHVLLTHVATHIVNTKHECLPRTLNAKKLNSHSLLLFFLLGQPAIFILNNHFSNTPFNSWWLLFCTSMWK